MIPRSIQQEVLQSLHSANQGVVAMNKRTKVEVYWPRIRGNRTTPTQAKLPPFEPIIPSTQFEVLVCDHFLFKGCYSIISTDGFSCWTEFFPIQQGTSESGSSALCSALRKMFSAFGVPRGISSHGVSEFSAKSIQSFLKRWGIHQWNLFRYSPLSNGHAEVAVKGAKWHLINTISANGTLDTEKMVRAILTLRDTSDPTCKLSPAKVIFGQCLCQSLPGISKEVSTYNNLHIARRWKEPWNLKEQSLKKQYVWSTENLKTVRLSPRPTASRWWRLYT